MRRSTAISVGFAVVLWVVGAQSATASWIKEGALLSGSAALASTAAVQSLPLLEGGGLTVECIGNIEESKGEIESPNKFTARSLIFTGCSSDTLTCTVPTTLGTVPITAELTEQSASEGRGVLKPQTGTVFETINVSGSACAAAGHKPLTGQIPVKFPNLETPEVPVAFSAAASGELKLGVNDVKFTTIGKYMLAQLREKFAFNDGEFGVSGSEGELIYNFAMGKERFEVKFGGPKKVKKVNIFVTNVSAVEYALEKKKIEPNETTFKFNGAGECAANEKLKPRLANKCKLTIEEVIVGTSTLKLVYNGGKAWEMGLTS